MQVVIIEGMLEQRTFSTNDLRFMSEAGMFVDQKVELINGVIYNMPASPQHENFIDILNEVFTITFTGRARVRIQNALDINNSAWLPHPDVMLVIPKDYSQNHPITGDVLLLIEVSLSTLQLDLNEKLVAYAKSGIEEYWVADLAHNQWIVHSKPLQSLGKYSNVQSLSFKQSFAPLAFPKDVRIWSEVCS